jgi:hypothetical protein
MEEQQVDFIMRTLLDLKFLNGLPVERDALEDDDEIQNHSFNDQANQQD